MKDEPEVTVPAPAPAASPAFFEEVDQWFATYFHNLGDRLDTELYNRFTNAKEELKQSLLPHLK